MALRLQELSERRAVLQAALASALANSLTPAELDDLRSVLAQVEAEIASLQKRLGGSS